MYRNASVAFASVFGGTGFHYRINEIMSNQRTRDVRSCYFLEAVKNEDATHLFVIFSVLDLKIFRK